MFTMFIFSNQNAISLFVVLISSVSSYALAISPAEPSEVNEITRVKLSQLKDGATVPRIDVPVIHADISYENDDDKLYYEFEFSNTGTGTLRIDEVVASCGCMYTLLGKDRLEPGETSSIRIGFSDLDSDLKTQGVMLKTNDPRNPIINLSVTILTESSITVEPSPIIIGDFKGTSSFEVPFYISTNSKQQLVQIESIKILDDALDIVELNKGESKNGELGYAIIGTNYSGPQDYRSAILIETNGERFPLIEVPVVGKFEYKIASSPSRILGGVIRSGDEKSFMVQLKKDSNIDFSKVKAKVFDSRVKVELIQQDTVLDMFVTIVADERLGMFESKILVTDYNDSALSYISTQALIVAD